MSKQRWSKKKQPARNGFVLFDVVYQDGSRTSNRKVPSAEVGGLDGDEPIRAFIEAQDRDDRRALGQSARPDQDHRPLAA